MGVAKGLAFLGIAFLGFGLFAMIFYQSGLLQKMQQENSTLALEAVKAKQLSEKSAVKIPALLKNPNGDTAIAFIKHHRPLEKVILKALDKGSFASKF